MEGLSDSLLPPGILVLELGLLLKLIQLAVSFLQANSWSFRPMLANWKQKCRQLWSKFNRQCLAKAASNQSEQELARMRCTMSRRAWWVALVLHIPRLLARQFGLPVPIREEFDLSILWISAMGVVIAWCPGLINSRSQDLLYMMAVLGMDAAILMTGFSQSLDVRYVITFTFPFRFVYAVLAKRAACVVLCNICHLLQAIHLASEAPDSQDAGPADLFPLFLSMFCGIVAVRSLLLDNMLLTLDVQKRSVELGAVSSLLTVCYDAVLEVDQALTLTQDDSPQLSSMLLRTQRGGLSGASLLDSICEGDRARVWEQFRSSTGQSAVALNADMLDSDFNRVKVELICVQFDNLTNDRHLLVGVREMQDLELGPAAPSHPSQPTAFTGDEDLFVVFDVHSLEVHIMSCGMQHLCQLVGENMPDEHILDVASPDTRLSLCEQLQLMSNAFAARAQPQKETDQEWLR
ncbi:unnamed protein product [Effrenium voratum]|nr:unnamed protein product [Effrenium voratum]